MHIAFARLFRIIVRHGWYPDGVTHDDFEVVPTPSTWEMVNALGFRVRTYADGALVFGEIIPGSNPPLLRRPPGAVSLRFAFEVRARNRSLLGITDLPAYRPARTIFCFDNLRQHIDPDPALAFKYLGDAMAGVDVGPAAVLVTASPYTYALGAAATTATITIRDRFGAAVTTIDARSSDPSASFDTYRLDLDSIPAVVPGRYVISDNHGGSVSIYYDPGVAASRPFGIVEIYSRTDGLTPDASDRVPASYRFMAGDALTNLSPYYVNLQPVATTWRYRVVKTYASNGIALNQLTIAGPIAFPPPAVSATTAVFTSTAPVRLSAVPRPLTLRKLPPSPGDIQNLPNPTLTTPLGVAAALPNFVSDMFVTV